MHYKLVNLVNNEWQCLLHNEKVRFDHVCNDYSDWHEHVKVHGNNQNGYNNQINKIQEI